jgi:hypothetical protein
MFPRLRLLRPSLRTISPCSRRAYTAFRVPRTGMQYKLLAAGVLFGTGMYSLAKVSNAQTEQTSQEHLKPVSSEQNKPSPSSSSAIPHSSETPLAETDQEDQEPSGPQAFGSPLPPSSRAHLKILLC